VSGLAAGLDRPGFSAQSDFTEGLATGATSMLIDDSYNLRSVIAAADGNLYVTIGDHSRREVLRVDWISGAA